MKTQTVYRFVLACLLGIAFLCAPGVYAADQSADQLPVKCLMIGKEPHREAGIWNDVIQDIKTNYSTVDLTVVEKENLEALKYENLKKFDVLLVVQIKAEKGNPPDYVKQGILQFLKDGGGLVVNHFAVANVQQWRDSIHIFGSMWVSGKSTHGPKHVFNVDMKDEGHPIVEGVTPFTTDDELYYNLLMRPDMHVIMSANENLFGHTIAEPMLMTYYVHNARCVYFALGHDVKACSPPQFRKIVAQSIEWAACRR